ncbi:phage tail protein [Pantoea dispersa]|uniref:phage tail protein n=1 Tax=Pantoea dispersa TaxID=59814 RepID=UPI003526F07A
MTTKYFALLTNQGAAKLANAAALGTKVNITSMGVGDGGGTLPTPDAAQTKLIGEKRRAQLNSLTVDAANSSQIIAEQIIPESEGGFWIREIGLYDADGVLIAVANCPETYKPQLAEGSGRTQTVRMILIVNSTSAVTLKIDPAVVLATRQYVDNAVIETRQYADKLLEQAESYAGDLLKTHLEAENPHKQYFLTANALSELSDAAQKKKAQDNMGLGSAALRAVGNTQPANLPDMSMFTLYGSANVFSAINIAGKKRIMEGSATVSMANGVGTFTLPLAFGSDGFTFLAQDVGQGVYTLSCQPYNTNKVTMYGRSAGVDANGTVFFKFIAMGSI